MHTRSILAACAACCITTSLFASGPCPCASDLNNDGQTNAADLAILLGAWGGTGDADLDLNGAIDAADLAILLGEWGPCAAPENDSCSSAKLLTGEITSDLFCTGAATTSTPPLPALCGDTSPTIGKDVWYRYVTPYSGKLIVHTCDSDFDTVLAVYGSLLPGNCACPSTGIGFAALRACNDDGPACDLGSFVEFDIAESECLNIRVGGFTGVSGVDFGVGELLIRPIKTGDRCDIAHDLPSQNHVTVSGTNAGDTWVQIDQSSCATGDTVDEWYRFEMPCQGSVTISTCTPSTDFDTTLAVFSGCGASEIACNDDSTDRGCQLAGLNRKSKIQLNADGGEVLYIRVSGFQAAVGAFELAIDVSCLR